MKHIVALLVLLCSASCVSPYKPLCGSGDFPGVPLPGFLQSTLQCKRADCPSPEAVAAALRLVDDAVQAKTGQRSTILQHTSVIWELPPLLMPQLRGQQDPVNLNWIHVYPPAGEGLKVSGSGLAHEALHLVGQEMFKNVDAEHLNPVLWRHLSGEQSLEDLSVKAIVDAIL